MVKDALAEYKRANPERFAGAVVHDDGGYQRFLDAEKAVIEIKKASSKHEPDKQ